MKRNEKKVPGFDDIIFRDRNKEYGAYDLRRRYGSTMSISIVAGLIFSGSVVLVPFFTADHPDNLPGQRIMITAVTDPDLANLQAPPELPKPLAPPVEMMKKLQFVPPVIVADELAVTNTLMTVDALATEFVDGLATEILPDVSGDPDPVIPPEEKPFIIVKEMPSFPGGESALLQYVTDHIKYPEDALMNRIQGTVILRFVVSSTGEIKDVELMRGVDPLLDNEAIKVISGMPHWKPGKQDGRAVPVYFNIPVVFRIK
jgi:protein TonB